MATSDERRDVAENLLHLTIGHYIKYKEQFYDLLEEELSCCDYYNSFGEVLERLADLIDPTCEMREVDGGPGATSWVCSCCGHRLTTRGEHVDFGLAYCPNCGARVVRPNGD